MVSLSLHTHRVRGKPHAWDPAACLASAEALVAFIRDTLASHHPTSTATPSSGEDHFQDQDDYPVFRVSFGPSSSSSSSSNNDNARNPPPSSSSSAPSPRPPMAVTIRLLSRAEVEQQVLAGKQEVRSPPTTTTTTTTKAAGRDRIGFLPRRWVEAVHERRRKLVSSLAAEEAARRASESGDGDALDGPPNSAPSAGTG